MRLLNRKTPQVCEKHRMDKTVKCPYPYRCRSRAKLFVGLSCCCSSFDERTNSRMLLNSPSDLIRKEAFGTKCKPCSTGPTVPWNRQRPDSITVKAARRMVLWARDPSPI